MSTETFTKDRVDFGFCKVPNGLWTCDLSYGAKCLIGWLWSHDHDYLAHLSVRRIGVEFGGGGQVVEWLRDLEAKGFLTKTKSGTQFVIHLVGAKWKGLTVRKPNASAATATETERYRDGNRTVTVTETEHREEQLEDQLRTQIVRKTSSSSSVDAEFDDWWKLYPKKTNGKGEARKVWRRMKAVDRAAAFAGIRRHLEWWVQHETEVQFIPAGSVWLNQRRWEDDEPRQRLEAVPTSRIDRLRAQAEAAKAQTKTGEP